MLSTLISVYNENMNKKFCDRLRKLRTDSEFSQAKLAVALGIPQQTIDKWERGIIQPGMDSIIQLATFFRVSADYLLGLSDKMSSDI